MRKFFPSAQNYCSILASLSSKRPCRLRCCFSCRATFTPLALVGHPRGTLVAQISIAKLAARPDRGLLPRFRALALFGRRRPERVVKCSLPAAEIHLSRPFRTTPINSGIANMIAPSAGAKLTLGRRDSRPSVGLIQQRSSTRGYTARAPDRYQTARDFQLSSC